jgi:ABC-type multidrug transport system ATPase subunit
MGFQYPPEITGINLSDLLKLCLGKGLKDDFTGEERSLIEAFKLSDFLDRSINVGFSGGERKRSELLHMIFLKPKLLLLDEPDSGVDVESLKLIASEVQSYIEKSGSSALIVTHKGDILEYIKSEHACILLDSKFHCFPFTNALKEVAMMNVSAAKRRSQEVGMMAKESELISVPHEILAEASKAGLEVNEENRAGTLLHVDQDTIYAKVNEFFKGKIEIMDTKEALRKYPYLSDYLWRLVDKEKDEFTKKVAEDFSGGYFMRILPNVEVTFPLQSCLMITRS